MGSAHVSGQGASRRSSNGSAKNEVRSPASSAEQDESPSDQLSEKSREAHRDPGGRERDVERDATDKSDQASRDASYEVTFADHKGLNPRERYSWGRKWIMVLVVSSTSLCVTCTSSLYTSTYEQIEPEFGCSEIVATLGLSLFVAGLGLSPMVLGPLSEVRLQFLFECLFM